MKKHYSNINIYKDKYNDIHKHTRINLYNDVNINRRTLKNLQTSSKYTKLYNKYDIHNDKHTKHKIIKTQKGGVDRHSIGIIYIKPEITDTQYNLLEYINCIDAIPFSKLLSYVNNESQTQEKIGTNMFSKLPFSKYSQIKNLVKDFTDYLFNLRTQVKRYILYIKLVIISNIITYINTNTDINLVSL